MKKRSPLLWLIPLIVLLLLIPFVVPSSVSVAGAEEELPVYTPVELANPDPGPVPTEPATGKQPFDIVAYGPHPDAFGGYVKDLPYEYLDGTISVRIETRKIQNTRVLFTWVQIADPSQLRAQFSYPYPSEGTIYAHKLALRERAVLLLNGDYCTGIRAGTVIRNGQEFRRVDAERYDQLIIDNNGDFHILQRPLAAEFDAWQGKILHSFVFGPGLVIDGKLQEIGSESDYGSGMTFKKKAQRQAICQMDTLSYLIITTEGPDQSSGGGFTLYDFAQLVYDCGPVNAYNLDGGSSTYLIMGQTDANNPKNAKRINNSNGKNIRPITDAIYFVTAEPAPEPELTPELIPETTP